MLRIVAKQVCRSRQIMSTTKPTFRQFSGEKFTIPSDKELQTGRRKDELDAEERGEVGFNLHPIVPPNNAGTKANPILVPSGEHCRTVGYEDPVSGQVVWFNLTDGPLHFIPDLGLYFKLQHNGSASSHH